MIEPTNDQSLPFYVLVESTRGPKFYSGAATREDADALVAQATEQEANLYAIRKAERATVEGERKKKYTTPVVEYRYYPVTKEEGDKAIHA